MTNPFDIDEDKKEYNLDKCRTIAQRTREAINYLRTVDLNILNKAERKLAVNILENEQNTSKEDIKEEEKYRDSENKKLTDLIKIALCGFIPKTLEEKMYFVQNFLFKIPQAGQDKKRDYVGIVGESSYAYRLRRLAKHAWDIQNER